MSGSIRRGLKSIYVAATNADVGKTVVSLGLVQGLKKRFERVSYMKPVGTQTAPIVVKGTAPRQKNVDETRDRRQYDLDAEIMKESFKLPHSYSDVSPFMLTQEYQKKVIDSHLYDLDENNPRSLVMNAYERMSEKNDMIVIEGTGHTGVGSVLNLNSVTIAQDISVPIVLVGEGVSSSTIDSLALNREMCRSAGVEIAGVVFNKVNEDDTQALHDDVAKVLRRWGLPLLGAIPYDRVLSDPSMRDFEVLFNTMMISGESHRFFQYKHKRLVTGSVDEFLDRYDQFDEPHHLCVTHAGRADIILALIAQHNTLKSGFSDGISGLVLTGNAPPRAEVLSMLHTFNIPSIYVPTDSYSAMSMIAQNVPKLRPSTVSKIERAAKLAETHIDFDALLTGKVSSVPVP